MNAKTLLEETLKDADIRLNGDRPWDPAIRDERFYKLIFSSGTLGLGESYMHGLWDCERLDQLFFKAITADLEDRFSSKKLPGLALKFAQLIFNLQTGKNVFTVGEKHYDFGNDMFAWMLGDNMNYSCAYWKEADNLEDAQIAKMKLICDKIGLREGMKVLDIGCGWGSLGYYMRENYGVDVTGLSISKEQIEYAKEKRPECEWLIADYREMDGKYDRIVSVGMFEHVGYKNYRAFMKKVRELLKDDGLFLLHTIGANKQRLGTDPWIHKYIFPNGMLPSQVNLLKASSDFFIMEDWHNFGADYDRTLMAWLERFEQGCDEQKFKHDEVMRRMFRYYLASCAAAFRARDIQLWQVVFSPRGVPGGYKPVR
ncbi:MAG: cyclopropane fatty acyl phospholipid synthase [Desulfovibrio sp.]|nr:cyclopropane fatty acyl phospholipid synthase [Desulfovibrio sp.]